MSFELQAGRVMALIGENGPGEEPPDEGAQRSLSPRHGSMNVAGTPYRPIGPSSARDAGIAMIYQELNLAPDLSVEDNIMLGQEDQRGDCSLGPQRPRVRQVLDRLGHPGKCGPTRRSANFPWEPSNWSKSPSPDRPGPRDRLRRTDQFPGRPGCPETVRGHPAAREDGIGVVYISHFLEEVRELCDDYTVLRDGQVAGTGVLEGTTEPEIVSMMVGRKVEELFPTVPHTAGDPVLHLEGLTGRATPRDIDLVLHRGEILGIAGLVGPDGPRCSAACLDSTRSSRARFAWAASSGGRFRRP
ncbi:MAG: hypothetical protein CM1200mP2_54190 [Planctomycetaceae bacterium]|nr:MAG: hypothetical protein CM1200mP2_54190 [Planctomycetaceae bacterium]